MTTTAFQRVVFAAGLAVIMAGCYTQALLDVDSMSGTNANDIVVSTHDGRRVSFSCGSYDITMDTTGRKVLEGTGRLQSRLSAQDEPFEGQIPVDRIESIHSPEKSAFYYVSVVAVYLIMFGRAGNMGV